MFRHLVAVVCMVLCVMGSSVVSAAVNPVYDATGGYLWYYTANIAGISNVRIDENGVVQVYRSSTDWQYNPCTIEQYGLEQWTKWKKDGNEQNKLNAYAQANWLVDNQSLQGTWRYDFPWLYAGLGETLQPGWISALAQGQGISLLMRVYADSHDEKYLTAARNALTVFQLPVEQGGVRRVWEDKWVWYEEYPTQTPSFVMNGFTFSLIGLYEMYLITDDPVVYQLYAEGEASLRHLVPLYDAGATTIYDLVHWTHPTSPPNLVRANYHGTHSRLMYWMNRISGQSIYSTWYLRWLNYKVPA